MKVKIISNPLQLEMLEITVDDLLFSEVQCAEHRLSKLEIIDWHKKNAQTLKMRAINTVIHFNEKQGLAFYILTKNNSDKWIRMINSEIFTQLLL